MQNRSRCYHLRSINTHAATCPCRIYCSHGPIYGMTALREADCLCFISLFGRETLTKMKSW
uniref:Uncharacterized protein n=1 Tax=Anguilla anguilla TaxID=7936 RepID=A0A0E9WHI1_ANGAN